MKRNRLMLGLGMGAVAGWLAGQLIWVKTRLENVDVHQSLSLRTRRRKNEYQYPVTKESRKYQISHTVQDGIERIVYIPKNRRYQTPILLVHGMWHGAWCWRLWQELLAEWGWESIAFSLPGHAGSPAQRPLPLCTLDYYLGFLKAEVERMGRRPIMVGHSMGGALVQWYLKYIGDLPAVVMAGSWGSHSILRDSLLRVIKLDPLGVAQISLNWTATPLIRSPERATQKLVTDGAVYSERALHSQLGPESALVLFQHNPPFWLPPEVIKTPILWLAGEEDAVISERASRMAATYYRADYVMVKNMGHDLMLERLFSPIVEMIHSWILQHGIE